MEEPRESDAHIARVRAALASTRHPVVLLTRSGGVYLVAGRATDVSLSPSGDLSALRAALESSESEPLRAFDVAIARMLSASGAAAHVVRAQPSGGDERFVELDARPVVVGGERAVLLQCLDVTDRERAARRERLLLEVTCALSTSADDPLRTAVAAMLRSLGWLGALRIEGRSRGRCTARMLLPSRRELPAPLVVPAGSVLARALASGAPTWCAPLGPLERALFAGRPSEALLVVPDGDGEEQDAIVFAAPSAARPERELLATIQGLLPRPAATRRHEGASGTAIAQLVERAAASDATVLLLGESGVGKTMLARRIHERGTRREAPFLDLNCAWLAPTLLESELFGHERGSFTGAHQRKRGLLETARGGTVFLDEIGELDPVVQAKLLKVLETRAFRRVGGENEIEVDVRFVAATNRHLREEVRAGRFREDLFYRLAVIELAVPPLRARRAELGQLAVHLLGELPRRPDGMPFALSPAALGLLEAYDWPGNVRELRNVLERAVFSAEQRIEARDVTAALPASTVRGGSREAEPLHEHTRRHVADVLEQCGYNIRLAAQTLGIARSTLYEWMRRDGIEPEQLRRSKRRGGAR